MPSPNDHVRTIIELLSHGGPDLVRRWVAALMIAPIEERESIVESVERTMTELYSMPTGSDDDVIGFGSEDETEMPRSA